ncbi:OmpH family outer membrane protein [Aquimarina agarivorans]|uniref:OmpH family outer membrane protein n=1 Tax=Aquimarina agarivorans TaxID=980584 RepID=UPI000248E66A|nr:OmpH family outer membrane protein [Aquimarina agarivorans]
MRIKILSIVACFLSVATFAQKGVRIGYIDMDYILDNVAEYGEAQGQLDKKVQDWKTEIELRQSEVEDMKVALSNEKVLLTKELIEEREEDIRFKEKEIIDYQQQHFGPQGYLVRQKERLVKPIQDQVFNAVQTIAETKRYDFIFDKSADVVMLYSADRYDISDLVLRNITRAAKRTQAQSKAEKRKIENDEGNTIAQDKELQARKQEQEAKQKERERLIAEKKAERDKLRQQKIKEYEERRNKLLAVRKKKRDSLQALKKSK